MYLLSDINRIIKKIKHKSVNEQSVESNSSTDYTKILYSHLMSGAEFVPNMVLIDDSTSPQNVEINFKDLRYTITLYPDDREADIAYMYVKHAGKWVELSIEDDERDGKLIDLIDNIRMNKHSVKISYLR
jgi:hypothetical protein